MKHLILTLVVSFFSFCAIAQTVSDSPVKKSTHAIIFDTKNSSEASLKEFAKLLVHDGHVIDGYYPEIGVVHFKYDRPTIYETGMALTVTAYNENSLLLKCRTSYKTDRFGEEWIYVGNKSVNLYTDALAYEIMMDAINEFGGENIRYLNKE